MKKLLGETKLRIGITLSGKQAGFWRTPLAQALRADGHQVVFVPGPVDGEPRGVALLTLLERLVYGEGPDPSADVSDIGSGDGLDLIVGGGDAPAPALNLICDGAPCAIGTAAAILNGQAPVLQACFTGPGGGAPSILASGRAAIENPNRFSQSRERIAGRLAQIARLAVRQISRGAPTSGEFPPPDPSQRPGSRTPIEFAARVLTEAVSRRLTRLAGGGDRWRIAWRLSSGDEVAERMGWPAFAYRNLADDGRRYYADPFVYSHQGRTFVFCEEYPFASCRGLLSAFEIKDGGVVSAPRPILEQPYHLSYPMVFARDGAIWMIPESIAANRIELWRATNFPHEWTQAAVLVDGVAASDATLLEHGGRLWLFATVADGEASSWDELHLWSADGLVGPWEPHPGNPVLIDASCARPAGMPFLRDGRWIRPAQDCSRLYGGGLALCAIDRLDEAEFSQSTVLRLAPPPGSRAKGVHTLNASTNLEVIDLFGPPVGG